MTLYSCNDVFTIQIAAEITFKEEFISSLNYEFVLLSFHLSTESELKNYSSFAGKCFFTKNSLKTSKLTKEDKVVSKTKSAPNDTNKKTKKTSMECKTLIVII